MVARSISVVVLLALLSVCALSAGEVARAQDPVVAAVGDMACPPGDPSFNAGAGTAGACRQRAVSDLVVGSDALLALGDNQYENGELANFQAVYGPTFGRLNSAVYPVLGNAEYGTPNAQGFYDYFASTGIVARIDASGGDSSHYATGGFYSFNLGRWHLIALNSNCAQAGGCGPGSPQEAWLRSDLAAHPDQCTLAYWHHPRWNTGRTGNDPSTAAFWTHLYNARADVVLNGHGDHHYERFAAQTPTATPDPVNGLRQFIVSTGGNSHGRPPASPIGSAPSEVSDYTSYGVLKLTLRPGGYDWQFVPAAGDGFTDSGSGTCHSTAPASKPARAFPATPVLDAFSRAAGVLGSDWRTPGLGDASRVSIAGGGATLTPDGHSSAIWRRARFGPDQEVYLTVPTLPASTGTVQLAARVSTLGTANLSAYLLRVHPSRSTWDLRAKINGATSVSVQTFTAPLEAGDAMGMRLAGATISVYRKPSAGPWTLVGSVRNTAIRRGGFIGFTLGDTTVRGGAFGGGTLPASPRAARRVAARVAVTAVRLTRGRLTVRGTITRRAAGGVTVAYRTRAAGRWRTMTATARIRRGRFAARLTVPASWTRTPTRTVTVTFGGSTRVRPGRAVATIR